MILHFEAFPDADRAARKCNIGTYRSSRYGIRANSMAHLALSTKWEKAMDTSRPGRFERASACIPGPNSCNIGYC